MKKAIAGLRYTGHILSHPIQGFYDLRFEGGGSLGGCVVLLVLLIASFVFRAQYSGFLYNTAHLKEFNIFREISGVLVPVLLWCVANWSITVLMDGKGRFADIFMATCYASVPYTFCTVVYTLLSQVISTQGNTFLNIVMGVGTFFTVLLLFSGTMTIHQFTVARTVAAVILTLLSMAFIVFLALLFAGIFDQLFTYVSGLWTEIQLRGAAPI